MTEAVLAELEACMGELERADPHELDGLEQLLARRGRAVLAATAGPGPPLEAEEIARLAQAWERGQRLAERLRLEAAGIRSQLQELHRAAYHARALAAEANPRPPSFELEA